MSDPKDLTSLNKRHPKGSDPTGEHASDDASNEAPPALEGLEDILEPMSPTSGGGLQGGSESASFTFSPDADAGEGMNEGMHAGNDPFANLPPMDPEIENLARGDSLASDSPPPLAHTPVGAAIQASIAADEPAAPGSLKDYSERLVPSSSPISVAHPYSVIIDGELKTHERETLLRILERENLGIREVELEPQFQAGRILIPRISEYAGIMIVQALRGAAARIRLGPSERIFISKDTIDSDSLIYPANPEAEVFIDEEVDRASDTVLLTTEASVPGRAIEETLDVIHASMNLKAAHVAKAQSPHFQEAIEKLKHQLRSQARHRGANALLSFKYELHPLEGQTIYKLVVQGTAVRLGETGTENSTS